MKPLLYTFLCFFLSISVSAQGVDFQKGDWTEAIKLAKKERKIVFVDAYTTWCGPCKKLSKYVFPEKAVGDFFNENFINVKVDVEKGSGRTFAGKYNVRSYPTLLFIDPDGKVIHLAKGYRQPESLIQEGKVALSKADFTKEYIADYESGDRSTELLRGYAIALKQSGKSHQKVTNEYLKSEPDFSEEVNLKALHSLTTHVDSKIFNLYINNQSAIEELLSKQSFSDKIKECGDNSLLKAIQYKDKKLVSSVKKSVAKYLPSYAAKFNVMADTQYYLQAETNEKKYLKSASKLWSFLDDQEKHELAKVTFESFNSSASSAKVLRWSELLTSSSESGAEWFLYAKVLARVGRVTSAIETAQKAEEYSKGNAYLTNQIRSFIQSIK